MLLTRMSLVVAVIMFAVALSALNAHAEPPPEARIRALEEQLRRTVRQLDDQRKLTEEAQRAIAELRAQVEEVRGRPASAPPATAEAPGASRPAATVEATGQPTPTLAEVARDLVAKRPVPFVLPWGKEGKLTLGGFVQTNTEIGDVAAFEGRLSGGPKELNDRFRLRRARINLSGDLLDAFDFKIEGDFQQGDGIGSGRTGFSGTDIFANWRAFPEANLKIGQYKAPFGLEQITSDTVIFTAERSLPTGALTPERQVGAELWGKPFATMWPERKNLLAYYAGVFGGNNRNTNINDNNDFMYVGRLELMPLEGAVLGYDTKLRVGGNGLYTKDAAGTDLAQTGNLLLLPDGSLTSFTTVDGKDHSPDERHAWGVDTWLTVGPFDLIGEYLEANVRPRGPTPNFAEFTANGYYVQPSLFVWGRKLQLVAKWERFSPDQARDDNIQSITGGLNYYLLSDNVKVMVDYIHTWSGFRDEHPESGRDQFDEMLARLQLLF